MTRNPAYLCVRCARTMCPTCKEIALEYEEMRTFVSVVQLGFEEERRKLILQIQSLNRRLECESELVDLLTNGLPEFVKELIQEKVKKDHAKIDRKLNRLERAAAKLLAE